MEQTRRRALAALGLGVVGGFAGCTGTSGAPEASTTDAPEEAAGFSGCPTLRKNADATVCAATAPEDAPVVLAPSRTDLDAPGTLRFTLTNGSGATLGLNPYGWAVHRERESEWERVAPDAVIQPWVELASGESQAWALRVGAPDGTPASAGDAVACGPLDLEAGMNAFSVVAVGEARTAYVARFRVR